MTKVCSRCLVEKPTAEFHRTKAQADGRNRQCKTCRREYYDLNRDHQITKARAWYAANRERALRVARVSNRRRLYGISEHDLSALKALQGDVCAICGNPPTDGRELHVDHDHISGRVRALLCNRCNPGIGHFLDDPVLLRAAADYIERHQIIHNEMAMQMQAALAAKP